MARKQRPSGFGVRGSALHEALKGRFAEDPAGMVLLVEACRLADRLDGLNEAVAGRGVIELMRLRSMLGSGDGVDSPIQVEVKFDSVLAEARQQANTLRLLLGQIAPDVPAAKGEDAAPQGGLSVDDLAARRRERSTAKDRAQATE